MSFNRKILSTIIIQAVGPLSFFLAVWFLSNTMGAEAQGKFSAVKSFVDLMLSLLIFGFPQSFVYGINRLKIARGKLIRWTFKYGIVCFALSVIFILLLKQFAWGPLELLNSNASNLLLLALSLSGLVIAALLRGVLLTITDGWQFSLLTILPSVSLSVFIIILAYFRYFEPLSMFFFAGLLSAVAGMWYVRGKYYEISDKQPLPWRELITNGGAVFIQGLLASIQPFITLSMIKKYGAGYNDVAFFSLSMYVYQAGIVPLTMVSPILYNRWTKTKSKLDVFSDLKKLFIPIIPIIIGVATLATLVPYVMPFAFNSEYKAAIPAIQIMLFAVPMLYVVQVGIPIIMSQGMFKINIIIVFIKLVGCILCLIVLLPGRSDLSHYAAISWAFSESVAALLIAIIVIRILGVSRKKSNNAV